MSALGKNEISIGAGEHCDIRLAGVGVSRLHATVRRGEAGQLLVTSVAGNTHLGDSSLAPGETAELDFSSSFTVGEGTKVPITHPSLVAMQLELGAQEPAHDGTLYIGRDPARCHLVLSHVNVSGRHAQLRPEPLELRDLGSTSGTWVDAERLPPEEWHSLTSASLVQLGPIPVTGASLKTVLRKLGHLGGSASSAPPMPENSRSRRHATIVGSISLLKQAPGSAQVIGRTPSCDIQISHPQVSSRHALLHHEKGQLFIEDCNSANGTVVRGKRIPPNTRVPVSLGEKVFIGPMPLRIEGDANAAAMVIDDTSAWAGRPLYEIEAWDLALQVDDRDRPGEKKLLLDHVSFKALPGDFIALMGPSGAGKTTLLLTLNGYLPPTSGQVRINGEDLYSVYDALRGSIGYVPQDDIVHPELTVWEAVRYSAKFRLPPDYSDEEIDNRVRLTLSQLGLESLSHLQIGKPEKKILSGGQRKRVNIALELVTDPVIMFLDEPTSGLAADDTQALVELLSKLAKDTGKTIIVTIHQPAKDEFEKFNLALIMGHGGIVSFYGPTHPDAYRFFGSYLEQLGQANTVDNPRDMFAMIQQREAPVLEHMRQTDPNATRAAARSAAARQWHDEYYRDSNATYQEMYSGKRAVGSGTTTGGVPSRRRKNSGQLHLLLQRYFTIKRRDIAGTAIMLLQAPVIAILLAIVFGGQEESIPYWCLGAVQELAARSGEVQGADQTLGDLTRTGDYTAAIFFLSVAAVWFGTSNAAREIVSERAIYLRERMVNLGLLNYVLSKFVLLSFVTVIQCTVLLGIVFFTLGFHGGLSAFAWSLATLIATAMNSVAVGLLLSTIVVSSEAAMALTPIALIPQVVLGGLMVPMTTNTLLELPMKFMPARWGFQGMAAQERMALAQDPAWVIDLQRPNLNSLDNFIQSGKFHCAEAQIASDTLHGAWGFVHFEVAWLPLAVLSAMMLGVLMSILVVLRRRDRI